MSITVHQHAVVSANAQLADGVVVEPFAVIEDNVVVGSGTHIGTHALVANGSRIGNNCRIHHGAAVGTVPQDLKFHGEESILEIGDHTTVREFATLNRGTTASGKTSIGHHTFIMAYAHVAHDCVVGSHVILANSVNLAGHVIVEDNVVIGGLVPIHQFVRIGCHAMVGGGYRVPKDVPPYILAAHEPLTYQGLNVVGLRRRNFKQETITALEQAYQIIYHSHLNTSQAIEKIRAELPPSDEIKHIIEFVEQSKRGIIWASR